MTHWTEVCERQGLLHSSQTFLSQPHHGVWRGNFPSTMDKKVYSEREKKTTASPWLQAID